MGISEVFAAYQLTDITPIEKLVTLQLANHVEYTPDGVTAIIDHDQLAAFACTNRNEIAQALDRLHTRGLVSPTTPPGWVQLKFANQSPGQQR